MKASNCLLALVITIAALLPLAAIAEETSPISKVLEMLSGLQAKIQKEGASAQQAYEDFAEWCEDRSKNVAYDIKVGKQEVGEQKASIARETAIIGSLQVKIEELASSIATDQADLEAATKIRAKEAKDFAAESKELSDVIDTLKRAVSIVEREMSKGGASMMQLKSAGSLASALAVMVQASAFSSADASRLTALVQSSSQSAEADDDDDSDSDGIGAPAAAVYKSQSGGIVDTLQDLLDKAEAQLDAARRKETNAANNFGMLKQSLEDSTKFNEQDMADAKKNSAQSAETKSAAEGDLAVTSKDLATDIATQSDLHHNCMTRAQDFEGETTSRGEELGALAAARKFISESTGGASRQSYGLNQVSFLQLSSGKDLAKFEAVRFVRELGKKQKDPALAQLAARMSTTMRLRNGDGSNDDVFAKVKGLIADMISKLQDDADADATFKAHCDKEISESQSKSEESQAEIDKLTTKIDTMHARSSKLKEEVASLQKALADLAHAQAEMDKLRRRESSAYASNSAEMKQGIDGVKSALAVLRDYYSAEDKSHEAAQGASSGVIGLLEVIEADFTKGLTEMTSTEIVAKSAYEQESKDNDIEKVTKEQDVKYKGRESKQLDKAVGEASSDRSGVQNVLDSVSEYLAKLKEQCTTKPDTYAERKNRREAELEGLKQALQILDGEAALIQKESTTRTLRGARRHHQ